MSAYVRGFAIALVVVLVAGLLLAGVLVFYYAVWSGSPMAWMMGRFGPGFQVGRSGDLAPVRQVYGSGAICPYGGSGSWSVQPGHACAYGGTDADGAISPARGVPLTLEEARLAVERYLSAYGDDNLTVHEVMEFELNFYAIVEEKDTDRGAFEVLVDKWGGVVRPEPGPNMMWNVRYGMMGGRAMMGYRMMERYGYGRPNLGAMTVTQEQAVQRAQDWLDRNLPGVQARPDDVDVFYGYYTLHVWKDGRIYGMLSVHGDSGQVWYHTWHGNFVAMLEF